MSTLTLLAGEKEDDAEGENISQNNFDIEIEPDTEDTEDSDEWEGTSGDILHMVVCQEEVSPEQERSSSLLQEEPEPPHIKEEQEETLQRPEEPDGSTLTSLAAAMKPAVVVLHKLPLNMFHQTLHPPGPLQQDSSEEESVHDSDPWWQPIDHSSDDPDWSNSGSESWSKKKRGKQKKGRKLKKDAPAKIRTSQANTKVVKCSAPESQSSDRTGQERDSSSQSSDEEEDEEVFPCSECPYSFTSQVFLHDHLKRRHNIILSNTEAWIPLYTSTPHLRGKCCTLCLFRMNPSIHPYIHPSSTAYSDSGHGGNSSNSDLQISLSRATSSTPSGSILRRSQASLEI